MRRIKALELELRAFSIAALASLSTGTPTIWANDGNERHPVIDYYQEGVEALGKGDGNTALNAFNRAISINVNNAMAFAGRGRAEEYLGRFQEALDDYTHAVGLHPENGDGCRIFTERGLLLEAAGKLDLALRDFNSALDLSPRNSYALVDRGVAYDKHGDYDKAISDFTSAIEVDPKLANAYRGRSLTELKQGKLEQASVDAQKSIKINPRDEVSYFAYGAILRRQRKLIEAEAAYSKGLELRPDSTMGLYARATLYMVSGDYGKMRTDAERLLAADDKSTQGLLLVAEADFLLGQFAETERDYKKAEQVGIPPDQKKYEEIRRCLLAWRLHGEKKALNRTLESGSPDDDWSSNIRLYIRGEQSANDLEERAKQSKGPIASRRMTEARYYIGEVSFLRGDAKGAAAIFRECLALDEIEMTEYHLAKAELKRLDGSEATLH